MPDLVGRLPIALAKAFGDNPAPAYRGLEQTPVKSTELRPGMAVVMDGNLFIVTSFQHVTPGNLRAFVVVKLKNVASGLTSEKRLRAGEEIERVNLDRRSMEYLYAEPTGYVFMDQETFDQMTIDEAMVGELMVYVKPNTVINVLMHGQKPVSIELPGSVDLQITDTTPQVKGATATNQLKEAELETGLKTRVPPFIEVGETVRVSTEDGSYLGRAN
mgnify:CR=1 FL=1